jgi:hypothetical protein
MVSEKLLCRVDNATDIEAFVVRFPKPLDKYLFVFWYRDTTYTSDSFGCTSIPNIFHFWILDEGQLAGQTGTAIPHINLTGNECNPHVFFRGLQFFWRNGLKLMISGYVYGGSYPKFISIYDVSDPAKPKLEKELRDGSPTAGNWWNYLAAIYLPSTDEVWFGDINGSIYYAKYDFFLILEHFQDAPKLITGTFTSAQIHFDWLGGSILLLRVTDYSTNTTKFYKIDASAKTYTDETTTFSGYNGVANGHRYVFAWKTSGSTITKFDIYSKPDLELVDSLSVNITTTRVHYITDLYDYIMVVDVDRIVLVNLADGSVTAIPYTRNLYQAQLYTPHIYGFNWVNDINTTGELYKLTLDYYYTVTYDPTTKKATIKDQAGNPLANATVYLADVSNESFQSADGVITLTTDANGVIDLSKYAGRVLRIVKVTT